MTKKITQKRKAATVSPCDSQKCAFTAYVGGSKNVKRPETA
ncbi:MAG: hypothetical protein SCH70_07125 [Candidatus Methanoperedens sp.]|nr:hypothetical protein [Candidatus Methanoperedens sp.]